MKTDKCPFRKVFIVLIVSIALTLPSNMVNAKHKSGDTIKSKSARLIHRNARRTCAILNRKRSIVANHKVIVASRRGYKPMAETDPPGNLRSGM